MLAKEYAVESLDVLSARLSQLLSCIDQLEGMSRLDRALGARFMPAEFDGILHRLHRLKPLLEEVEKLCYKAREAYLRQLPRFSRAELPHELLNAADVCRKLAETCSLLRSHTDRLLGMIRVAASLRPPIVPGSLKPTVYTLGEALNVAGGAESSAYALQKDFVIEAKKIAHRG